MDLKITIEEIKALMRCQPEVRYQYTLKRIADTEYLWSIIGNDSSFEILTYGNKRLFPIWPFKEYAEAFCINDKANFKCYAISLNYFEDSVIDFICENGLLISVFPTEREPIGKIVNLNKFVEDLSVFLEDY